MPFKKGKSGNPLGRPVGSGNNDLRKIINESIDPNKIREMLNKIEDPIGLKLIPQIFTVGD